MSALTWQQKLSAARIIIRDRLPYFRAALFGAQYKVVEGLGTYAMSHNGVLMVDPVVVARETVENAAASILHELLHWLRDHSKRAIALAANPRLWNFAADAEINDDIVAMGVGKLPDGCVFAKMFKGSDGKPMADGNVAEVYYQSIRQQAQQIKQPGMGEPGEGEGEGDGDGEGSVESDGSGDQPGVGHGWCGSAAGRPHPKEPKGGKGSKSEQDKADGKGESEGQGQGMDGKTEAEASRVRKAVAEAAVKHAAQKGRGSVPAGFLAWAESEIAPPKVDWRTRLAKCLRAAMAYRPGCITTTWTGFGRKQAALGFGPGRPMTPKWRSPVPRVAIAIDTSGSMGSNELGRAAAEVGGILKAVNATVEIVACDAAIHATKTVRTWQEAVKEFKGGGGTSFIPVFDYFNNRRNELPPEVLVFITDGCGPAPAAAPPGYTVIWVLVGPYKQRPCTWGTFVEVDEDDVPAKATRAA